MLLYIDHATSGVLSVNFIKDFGKAEERASAFMFHGIMDHFDRKQRLIVKVVSISSFLNATTLCERVYRNDFLSSST